MLRFTHALVALLLLAGCDSGATDDAPPAGVRATVDGATFHAIHTMGWAGPSGSSAPLSISGSAAGDGEMRTILLTVPNRIGTFTHRDAEVSASYTAGALLDTTLASPQVWLSGEGALGTTLEIRVSSVNESHARGTFAFQARHTDDPTHEITVTGGTFNVALSQMPDFPTRAAASSLAHGAVLHAAQALGTTVR